MWPHFTHLFWQIIHGMPILVSSNWASWLILIGTFLLTEGLLFVRALREGKDMRQWWANWWKNLALGLLVTAIVYGGLFLWSAVQTVYDEHHDSVGRWQVVVKEKDSLKAELQKRDDYIKVLEGKKCPKCPQRATPTTTQPRALTELQRTVLERDLEAGAGRGWRVRINAIGSQQDTRDFAEELADMFKGWQVKINMIETPMTVSVSSDLEFVIPEPQDPSVQMAIHAFDHAHVQYSKNVDPYAYRGPFSVGEPPALTINVVDLGIR